jgi:ParB-like chromosome segregation protein Spo0J
MKIEKLKISKLNPAEYNPRKMTNKQYEDLKSSLEKFGLVDPIIINADNTVVGGHQRLRIMRELGAEYVPTVRVNLSKEDEKELNIRLNKNTGEFDLDVLANNFEVDELKDWGFKDVELGFNIDKMQDDLSDNLELQYKIEVDVISEKEQEKLYNELTNKGYTCRILTL